MKLFSAISFVLICLIFCGCSTTSDQAKQPAKAAEAGPMEIPVVIVKYFPVTNEGLIDIRVTGDWGASLEETRDKTDQCTKEVIETLEQGSRFRGYKNPDAKPSLKYKVVKTYEFLKPLPTCPLRNGETVPFTDYNAIVNEIDIKDWVENKGVKEVWIWGYHGGKVGLWESNMSSPTTGDISNSSRDPNDLPLLSKTYTVYHYNYQRGPSEAVEDHMHQCEAVFNYIDGRDQTPPEKWPQLLFWGKFVGSDISHKLVTTPRHCGWAHYAPNSTHDYDWGNKDYVETDIEDWKPDDTGKTTTMNCDRWDGSSIKWFRLWMQSIPGRDNGLTYNGKPLKNWWIFIGDYDNAVKAGKSLVEE